MAKIPDPSLKFLNVKSDKGDRKHHNLAVATVATALHKTVGRINYDHVDLVAKRDRSIPLVAVSRKKRTKADIAFWLHGNILVHVEIKTHKYGEFISDPEKYIAPHTKKWREE